MDKEKEAIINEIESKTKEIERLNLRIQIFTEVIAHLRSRVSRAEQRKAEIHNEIIDIKARVRAWEVANMKKDE